MRTTLTALALTAVFVAPAGAVPAGPSGLAVEASCATQCIRSGIVIPTTGTAKMNVRTTVRATLRVTVRRAADGVLVVSRRTHLRRKLHQLHLAGLAPNTLYGVTVRATDAAGHVAIRTGTFRTRSVQTVGFDASSGLAADTGCATQCILTASSSPDLTGSLLDIRTTTAAMIELEADTSAPQMVGGAPYHLGGAERQVTLPTQDNRLVFRLGALEAGTLYHVILRATDTNGHVAWRTGTIRTLARRVEVRFTHVEVIADADNGSSNRGEMRFQAGIPGATLFSTPCQKRKGGTWFVPPQNSLIDTNHGRYLSLGALAMDWDEPGADRCSHDLVEAPGYDPWALPAFGRVDAGVYDGSREFGRGLTTLDLDAMMPDGATGYVIGVEVGQTDPDARVRFRVVGELRVTAVQ